MKEPRRCYLVRDAAGRPESAPGLPSDPQRLRPRWAAAATAALVVGIAAAALVAPSPTAVSIKEPAAISPIATQSSATPLTPVVDQRGSGLDDGVPGPSTETAKARAGNCSHGM